MILESKTQYNSIQMDVTTEKTRFVTMHDSLFRELFSLFKYMHFKKI
jgi:hypothetical protein